MKKSIFCLLLAAGFLASCDPIKEDGTFEAANLSNDQFTQLINNAPFTQYAQQLDENGNVVGFVEAADGNYISYDVTGVANLKIYTLGADGAAKDLMNTTTGTFTHAGGGMFSLVPRRGSDPEQTVYFSYINPDGVEVVASRTFTVAVPGDIAYELKLIASNDYGEKVWKWDPSITGAVWGNMGYKPGSGASVGTEGNGQWWGVTSSEEFDGQLQHTHNGQNNGDGNLDAYMVINEDGTIKSYDKDGKVVREGTFTIEGYDNSDPDAWRVGLLKTDAILWPYEINSGGNIPGEYEIVYLTPDKMTLVYPDNANWDGSWSEATFWHFCSTSDLIGFAAGYEKSNDWTWDSSITGAVWGNMGYCGGNGSDVGLSGSGQWWGVTSTDEFNGQLQHTHNGVNNGDGDLDAYMTFDTDGLLKSYDASGSVVRSGTYEFKLVNGSSWKVADLNTDAILWPYEINSGGNIPGTYEVVYMTNEKLTLVYPDGGAYDGLNNWGEATFWHFKKK